MSVSDKVIFEDALSADGYDKSIFNHKYYGIVNDNNGTNYSSGQLQIDCSALANSSDYVSWSEGFIIMPMTGYAYGQDSYSGSTNFVTMSNTPMLFGMKSGSWNIFDSLQCTFNNKTVIQQITNSSLYWNFKQLTSWSQDAVKKWGNLYMFQPDDYLSVNYVTTGLPGASGVGEINNIDYTGTSLMPAAGSSVNYAIGYNSGFYKRQLLTATTANASFANTTAFNQMFRNYFTTVSSSGAGTATGANGCACWFFTLCVPLKALGDFFCKVPLCKNSYMNLILNLNQTQCVIQATNATGLFANANLAAANITTYGPAQSTPWMISSMAASNGGNCNTLGFGSANLTNLTMGLGVVKPASGVPAAATNPFLSVCRLYAPLYSMQPSYEEQYLANRVKTIQYESIFQYTISNQAAGAQFSNIITTKSNMKRLVVIPQIAGAINGASSASAFRPMLSPFSTSPCTCAPVQGTALYNIIVTIGGLNISQQPIYYTYENFIENIAWENGVMGGQSWEVSSGLIDSLAWNSLYGYYVFDLERIVQQNGQDPNVSRTVTLQATNNSLIQLDYFCFVVTVDTMTIDVVAGRNASV